MSSNMSGPFKPEGKVRKSQAGAWGGGTTFTQSPTPERKFVPTTPFSGHTQKKNIEPVIKNK